MQYIVMDLEWNQPTSYNSSAYKSVGEKLLFELIQIGAVKMNEKMEVVDSFTQMIRPVHYARLHPRIKRITHITQEELDEAPAFDEALRKFSDFLIFLWLLRYRNCQYILHRYIFSSCLLFPDLSYIQNRKCHAYYLMFLMFLSI